jgi:hypothetical protein
MIVEAKIAPKNSLLLVMDKDSGEIPESMGGKLVVSTHSCVAIGTRSETDGQTLVTLTDENIRAWEDPNLELVFSGTLATPNKEVYICTVLLETILRLSVPNTETGLEVWANHEIEPTRLCVSVRS